MNKIFCIDECGPNALDKVFELDNIFVCVTFPQNFKMTSSHYVRFNNHDEMVAKISLKLFQYGGRYVQNNRRIIYNNMRFSSANLTYDLQFRDYFTMIAGDSGTGKMFLFNRLRDVKALKLYDKLQLYNAESENFDSIYDCSGKLIVIDNFDILVSDRLRDFLQYDRVNQFLIFGRNTDGLPVDAESFLQLCKDNKRIYFRGVFDDLFVN